MSDAPELDLEAETPLHKEHGIWVYRSVSAAAAVDDDSVLAQVREQRSRDLTRQFSEPLSENMSKNYGRR